MSSNGSERDADGRMTVTILGAAGFLGSILARKFVDHGDYVIGIDGFLDGTGASRANLRPVEDRMELIDSRIEDVTDLGRITRESDVIVDC